MKYIFLKFTLVNHLGYIRIRIEQMYNTRKKSGVRLGMENLEKVWN